MKGFLLDENGDIVLSNEKSGKQIQIVSGNDLIAQKIQAVLGTNKGEWFLDGSEGVDFDYLIGKGITEDMIRSQIEDGVHQVSEALYLSEFNVAIDKKSRTATINFTVEDNGETILKLSRTYGSETNANAASKLAEANATLASNRAANAKLERILSGQN
jgi:hypothetical protein